MTGRTRDPHWLFAYGSLMWRRDFDVLEARPARLRGWTRRLWQGSTDHRGRPAAPGRVVTLVEETAGHCDGIALRLDDARLEATLAHLDHRERGGYRRLAVTLDLGEQERTTGFAYVADPANPNWLGPASTSAIARQIARSEGPSGPNPEYVVRLAAALRSIGADDPHVFEAERLLLQLSSARF